MPDTTPLALPECPREDCTRTVRHYHEISRPTITHPCVRASDADCANAHGIKDGVADSRCYAPRNQPAPARPPVTAILDAILAAADDAKRAHDQMCDLAETLLPAPQPPAVVLPTVDEVARTIMLDDGYPHREIDPAYLRNAQAVLDLIAGRVTPWKPVAPGTTIKAGARYRIEWDGDGVRAMERTHAEGFTIDPTDPARYFIDPRTVPAEPEDPRVAVVEEWLDAIGDTGEGPADLLVRLDAMGADQ